MRLRSFPTDSKQMGGVDLSPIALLLLIQIAEIVLHTVQMQVSF